jgi:signal transduction histidine kinase
MPHLFVKTGLDAGRRFDLPGSVITVGRHSSNLVYLGDDRVSRKHLELRAIPSGYKLVDLGSGNGTSVNGQVASERDLVPGDEIRIGDTVLVYNDDAAEVSRFHASIVRTVPEADGPRLLANLGVLYEASAAVSHILDVDELLGRILDLVLNATAADHAAALLADSTTGELMPRVVRSGNASEFAFSRTIVDYVQRERQGVFVADAAADDRFTSGESIVRHALREVICAPMRGRHESVGVLFLDTLTSTGRTRFTADHLNLAVAIAHQAALAVEGTRYYRALLDSERLAAVGQTIAGMSHHIKNIMQGVRFGGDMVRAGLGESDSDLIAKGWNLVEKNQARIDALIRDMLSYSKEREPAKEPTDLSKVIEEVLDLVRGRADERRVAIEKSIPANAPFVACDGEAIHAAVLNVVGNAIDALESVASPRIRIELKTEGESAVIAVEDNGPGVPSEQREAIFQPFVSSKGTRGTGLGLPVSRKILREHGGDLTVEDAAGGGARFAMRIPGP